MLLSQAPTDSSPAVTAQQCLRNTNREDCIFLHEFCVYVPDYGCFPKVSFPHDDQDTCSVQAINKQEECQAAFQHKFSAALISSNDSVTVWCELAPQLIRDCAKQCVRKCLTANATFLGLVPVQQWCDNMANGIGSLTTRMRRHCKNNNQTCNLLIAQGLTENAEMQSLLLQTSNVAHLSNIASIWLIAVVAVLLM